MDLTVRELAELICEIIGFKGGLSWDRTKPDGTPRKVLDISKIESLGWNRRSACAKGSHRPTNGLRRTIADPM